MDNEFYQLCKETYKLTGWDGLKEIWLPTLNGKKFYIETAKGYQNEGYPLYTSDYLLEKLPKEIDGYPLQLASYGGWTAKLTYDTHDAIAHYQGVSDTPLKALLKLTIELHKQGLLEK